ncbi:MAG TPA: type II secretion system F family protein [Armatimonadota bacterium]|jgi:type IV pilus assembly protein PilC|nr:type II secretion system F family protein [Armatimonadota bacterium]HOJ20416.1 type II secretion system F family protein [Armatimonadota bacterium]HOM83082.1 type II secretion system F family protein [Armatimonadota bacterium]HPO72944.1 type II secretion system F family protein [Armatimonadota bacterium]HPT98732.1 type II secretion system F family protein [Armatimonadota bacterium]
MPVYQYRARDAQGQLVTEVLAYEDELSLRRYLRENDLFVLGISEVKRSVFRNPFQRGVGLQDLIIMTRQLRTMIHAGMPLYTGLETLAEQTPNPKLAEVLTEVARAVAHGVSISSAMAQYPRYFPPMLLTLIQAGEEGGRLPETLNEAARQLELLMEIRQKLISALVYPAFTFLATVGTVAAMLIWIVPVFAQIYEELNAPLPGITRLLIAISDLVVHNGWIMLLALIAGLDALRRYYRTPRGRLRIDGLKIRIPLLGQLFLKSATANLTGSLAGLLRSGVGLLPALQTAAQVCGNEVLAEAARTAAKNVSVGRRLSEELEASGQFPAMVIRMVAVAEDLGTLPDVLQEITVSYNEDVEYTIRRMMALVEPVTVLCLGGVVGFVLVALYYPIFNMGNVFLSGA